MSENSKSDLEITLLDGRTLTINRSAIPHAEILEVEKLRGESLRKAKHYDMLAAAQRADPRNLELIDQVIAAETEWQDAFDASNEANDRKVAGTVGLTLEELRALPEPDYGAIQQAVLEMLRRERGVDPN
jgi:hypothetical protein